MKFQTPQFQEAGYLPPPLLQLALGIGKQHEIIDVSNIGRAPETFLHKMVKRVQIEVGKELTRQIAYRQALTAVERRQQVISWEVVTHKLLSVATVNYQVDKPQCFVIRDRSVEHGFQNLVVDRWEVLLYVALEYVVIVPKKRLESPNSSVSAFGHAIGIAVIDEATLKQRTNHI